MSKRMEILMHKEKAMKFFHRLFLFCYDNMISDFFE